jgi:Bacterial Ig domain
MPLLPSTRAGLAPAGVIAALVLALMLAAAAPASAITRKQAAQKALAALGTKNAAGPVVVLGLRKAVRARTRVRQARINRPWDGGQGRKLRRTVIRVGRGRAFLFYEDRAPLQPYKHPGRVALVAVKSGKVRVSRTIEWPPLVRGKLPAFLTSFKRYHSPRYRVFSRVAGARLADGPFVAPGPGASGPGATEPGGGTGPGPVISAAPIASDQHVVVKQDTPKNITLTGFDEDGDPLIFEIVRPPENGELSGQPPNVTYTPEKGFLGEDAFLFRATDGEKESDTAKVTLEVVPVGRPPALATSPGCTAYDEQSREVEVDRELRLADDDDTVLDSARVRIAADFQGGDDLLFTDQKGISGSYDDSTGTLYLFGDAPVEAYQEALRSVRYRNLSSGNPTKTKAVEFTVSDAGANSEPAAKEICVKSSNDPPIGEVGEGALFYTEKDGPVRLDAGFVVGDPDSSTISGATVEFVPHVSQPVDKEGNPDGPPIVTDSFDPAQDELIFRDQNGISGSYDDSTGRLKLSGNASLAAYERAIRSVLYENSSEDPSELTRRVQFQVTDSSGAASTPTRRDIYVTAVK